MSRFDKILIELGTNNSSQIATAVLAGFKMIFLPIATATDKNATADQKKYTIIRDLIMEGLALITYIGVTGQIQKHATAPICSNYFKKILDNIEKGKLKPVVELTQEDKTFLKNVDYKKIKEFGKASLKQGFDKNKDLSESLRTYLEKFESIVNKINGETAVNAEKETLEAFKGRILGRTLKKYSSVIFQDFKNTAKDAKKVLDPIKAFQNTRIALSQLSVWALALIIIPPMCNAIISPVMKKLAPKQTDKPTPKPTALQSFTGLGNVTDKKTFSNFYNYFPNSTTGMRV